MSRKLFVVLLLLLLTACQPAPTPTPAFVEGEAIDKEPVWQP